MNKDKTVTKGDEAPGAHNSHPPKPGSFHHGRLPHAGADYTRTVAVNYLPRSLRKAGLPQPGSGREGGYKWANKIEGREEGRGRGLWTPPGLALCGRPLGEYVHQLEIHPPASKLFPGLPQNGFITEPKDRLDPEHRRHHSVVLGTCTSWMSWALAFEARGRDVSVTSKLPCHLSLWLRQ